MRSSRLLILLGAIVLAPGAMGHPLEEMVDDGAVSACVDPSGPTVRVVEEPTCAGGSIGRIYVVVRCILEDHEACRCITRLPQCAGFRILRPNAPYLP